jgi:flagellar motor switch/type III secretory pathway protein FliN
MSAAAPSPATSSAAAEKALATRPVNRPELGSSQPASEKLAAEKAETDKEEACWRPVLGLPCQLVVELPLPDFKVADFLGLQPGSVIGTGWRITHDVPLRVNGTLIGWGEFDGSGNRLSVRLTELA